MELKKESTKLPENAYKELKPGEIYRPVMSPEYKFPEVTGYSVFWGLIMAVIFSAAAAYSGLKIGQVMEAAIPISILAVGISTAVGRRKALGQNVIIQSIGATSGVIVAGAIFTIPALYIFGMNVDFIKLFLAALLGGCLGILFLIPFRKYFVKDMHGKLPFPEATATTEILITGERGGKQAAVLAVSGLIAGGYDFIATSVGWWAEVFTSRILPIGAHIADKWKVVFRMSGSSMIFGFGYLIGLRYSTIITVGSLLSWFVFVPLIAEMGNMIHHTLGGDAAKTALNFAKMSPEAIFKDYVRLIGIGGIAMAGLIGILKNSKVIGNAFSIAMKGIFGSKKPVGIIDELRTQRDIKFSFIFLFIILTIIAIFIFFIAGVQVTLAQAIIALLAVVIISFLFTTVAANAIAIVGSNPVSGMTLMTLILSSVILTQVGLKGDTGIVSALLIGGIVCTALSTAGGFVTDLKIGYWIGSSPYKQESWKFLGTLVSAATVGVAILILNASFGFTKEDYVKNQHKFTHAQIVSIQNKTADSALVKSYQKALDQAKPLVAPQANAMKAVIEPFYQKDKEKPIPWMLYFVGAIIALILNALKISPLAFALGMYLPLELNTPLLAGGLLAHFVSKSSKDPKLCEARSQRGTLIMSGFIAGGAIFGVLGALLRFFGINLMNDDWASSINAELIAIGMFILLVVYSVWDSLRAKIEEE